MWNLLFVTQEGYRQRMTEHPGDIDLKIAGWVGHQIIFRTWNLIILTSREGWAAPIIICWKENK